MSSLELFENNLSVHGCLHSLDKLPLGWHVKRFVDVRERSVQAADTSWRSVKVEEAVGRYGGLKLSAETARDWRFMRDNAPSCFAYRVADGFSVPRKNRNKIDHLDRDAKLFVCDVGDLKSFLKSWRRMKTTSRAPWN